MRIAHIDYNFIYELEEHDRGILIVENAMFFRKIIDEMRRSIVDKEEIFIFSENNKTMGYGRFGNKSYGDGNKYKENLN